MIGVKHRPSLWSGVARGLVPLLLAITSPSSLAGEDCPGLFKRLLIQSGFPTAAYRRSARQLEQMVADNLSRSGPRESYRALQSLEHTIVDINEGRSFNFKFEDYRGFQVVPAHGRAIGREVRFKAADGKAHTIEILVPEGDKESLDTITREVLSLPSDALPAIQRVELSPRISEGWRGLYADSGVALLARNRGESTLRHEFGHSLAELIWGKPDPFKEWKRVFRADGERYVTHYAWVGRARHLSGFTEDFAESVMLYLNDADRFATQFPHRAALLDTIFRNPQSPFGPGGVWAPIRTRYNSLLFPVWRYPISSTIGAIIAIPGMAGMTFALNSILQSERNQLKTPFDSKGKSLPPTENKYRSDPRFWENGYYRREGLELERDTKKADACLRATAGLPKALAIEASASILKIDGPSEAQSGNSYEVEYAVRSETGSPQRFDVVLVLVAPSETPEKSSAGENRHVHYTHVIRDVVGMGGSTEIEIPENAPSGKYQIRLCAFENPGEKIHIVEKNIEISK